MRDRPYLRPADDVLELVRLGATLRADAFDVEHERPFEAAGRVDGDVLAVELDVLAIRSGADIAPPAAGQDVHLGDPRGRAVRAPPAGDEVGVGECLPD